MGSKASVHDAGPRACRICGGIHDNVDVLRLLDKGTMRSRRLAIEDEAVKAERERLRAAVEGLPRDRGDETWDTVARDDALARQEARDGE